MHSCDICLVKPGSQKVLYGTLSDFELTALEPPLWSSIVAGYLRGKGYSVVLLDAEVEDWSWEETARQVLAADPAVAVVTVSGSNPSASTMNMVGASAILRHLKELDPERTTGISGLHPSALPERTLDEESADYVIVGEGFHTFPALIDAVKAGANVYSIEGLAYRRDGKIVVNPMPPLLANLDTLPLPAWDLLPMERYRAHNWHCFDNISKRQQYAVLYTSLGCPYSCSFCCINALFGVNTIRYRGIDSVMSEIDMLVNTYGVRNIKIMDEMFALNEARVIELCDRIIERKYDLNFWAYARVNTVTKRMLSKMKAAGINWIAYGFESGSTRVLKDVSKGYDADKVMEVVRSTYAEGIHIGANYIFGLPEDDFDSMNETFEMMLDINAEWANIYSAMALPGSKLYASAIENNWPLPKTWLGYSQYSYETLPLPTKYLTGGQVLAFRDYAFTAYYESPRYLEMIRRKLGVEAFEHVRRMSQKKLDRRHAAI